MNQNENMNQNANRFRMKDPNRFQSEFLEILANVPFKAPQKYLANRALAAILMCTICSPEGPEFTDKEAQKIIVKTSKEDVPAILRELYSDCAIQYLNNIGDKVVYNGTPDELREEIEKKFNKKISQFTEQILEALSTKDWFNRADFELNLANGPLFYDDNTWENSLPVFVDQEDNEGYEDEPSSMEMPEEADGLNPQEVKAILTELLKYAGIEVSDVFIIDR